MRAFQLLLEQDCPTYPKINVVEDGEEMGISTNLRHEHEGKWYLQRFNQVAIIKNPEDKIEFIQQFYSEVYRAILFGKVNLNIVFPPRYPGEKERLAFVLDEDQTPELERMKPFGL